MPASGTSGTLVGACAFYPFQWVDDLQCASYTFTNQPAEDQDQCLNPDTQLFQVNTAYTCSQVNLTMLGYCGLTAGGPPSGYSSSNCQNAASNGTGNPIQGVADGIVIEPMGFCADFNNCRRRRRGLTEVDGSELDEHLGLQDEQPRKEREDVECLAYVQPPEPSTVSASPSDTPCSLGL